VKATPLVMDARMVGAQQHGIARYVVNLARALRDVAPEWQPTLLLAPDAPHPVREEFTHAICPVPFLHAKEVLAVPAAAAQLRPRLFHCTSFATSPLFTVPFVITLHDAIHLMRPQDYGFKQALYYRTVVVPAAHRAQRVITVSETSRQTLAHCMRLGKSQLVAIPNGVETSFSADRPDPPREGFVLTVCGPKPHKNTQVLVHALRHALDLRLCVAGQAMPGLADIARSIGVHDRVQWLGAVDDVTLHRLYRQAAMLAVPSTLEGFGLPVVEAMASGCPVVVSDIPVMHEVAEHAARYVAPLDAPAWAAALTDLMRDKEMRATMEERGRERALEFTWRRTAAETARVYDETQLAPSRVSLGSRPYRGDARQT
jgi:glycosyltransferase involved in cell wall biosynthesis